MEGWKQEREGGREGEEQWERKGEIPDVKGLVEDLNRESLLL